MAKHSAAALMLSISLSALTISTAFSPSAPQPLSHSAQKLLNPSASQLRRLRGPQPLSRSAPQSLSIRAVAGSQFTNLDLNQMTYAEPVVVQSEGAERLLREEVERVLAYDHRTRFIKRVGMGLSAGCLLTAGLLILQPDSTVIAALGLSALAAKNYYDWSEVNGFGAAVGEGETGLPASAFEIRSAGAKGLGLFATQRIKKGTFLMPYIGERISELELYTRYLHDPTGHDSRYVMRVTDEEYLDAASEPESNVARYMNHDDLPNVDKFVARRPGGFVNFFAARDIEAGEELCYKYSNDYWDTLSGEKV